MNQENKQRQIGDIFQHMFGEGIPSCLLKVKFYGELTADLNLYHVFNHSARGFNRNNDSELIDESRAALDQLYSKLGF